MKKINIFGKQVSIALMIGLLFVGAASGVLVNYLSNTISEEVVVESPIELVGTEFEFDIAYGGEDDFVLIKLVNKADVDITGDFEVVISPDVVGISMAISEDISYCFKDQGDMTNVSDCETDYLIWMANNIDWNDWYGDKSYSDTDYPSALVVNTNGDSFVGLGYTGNKLVLPGLTLGAGESFYGVIYMSTNVALVPATYNFDMVFVP